jgi:hypothetical protein
MRDQATRGAGRARNALSTAESSADSVRNVRESIRQAFLVHMMEQQRQFGSAMLTAGGAAPRESTKNAEKSVRHQQPAGNHEKGAPERARADRLVDAQAGAETVEAKR